MLNLRFFITGSCLLLASAYASAQDPLRCQAPRLPGADEGSLLSQHGAGDPDVIEFRAGEVEAAFGENPSASLSGGVLLRSGDRLAGANAASFDPETQSLFLNGDVRYEDGASAVIGTSAEFGYQTGRIRFEGAEFLFGDTGGRGKAGTLEINREGRVELTGVGYTTCPPEAEDWIIQADEIDLDTDTGVGTARDVKLRFKGVPILYSPYLSFPISDARKSGILAPEIGSTARGGNDLSVPWYWNIAPNYDATFTPRLLTDRGLQMGAEFRYLLEGTDGIAQVEYLPDDSEFGDNRHFVSFDHQTLFFDGWRNLIDYTEVSDNQYFEDLGGSLSAATTTHLNRSALFDYYDDNWSLFAMVQDYQTIDSAIAPDR